MSHQTGIKANEELKKVFGTAKEGKTRLLKIVIEKEELAASKTEDVDQEWDKDYVKFVEPLIEEDNPCFILFRLDTKSQTGYEWLLLSWSPDSAKVRQKMIYASTKATLKKEFGTTNIRDEMHATTLREATLTGYKRYQKNKSAPAPLTAREEELLELRKSEVKTDVGTETRHRTLGGITCELTEAARAAIRDTASNSYNYLQFKIDLKEEKIHLVKASNVELEKLPKEIPDNEARYHIYLFKHTHEGDYLESFVFIYSMPGYSCPIKERMMYSSCKGPFLDKIADLGVKIEKKLEIDSGAELNEDYFQDELHPKTLLHRPQFAKPQGPKNRGAKRLILPPTPSDAADEDA